MTRVGKQIAAHCIVRGQDRMLLGRDEGKLIARAVELGAEVEEINITALPVGEELTIIEGGKNENS